MGMGKDENHNFILEHLCPPSIRPQSSSCYLQWEGWKKKVVEYDDREGAETPDILGQRTWDEVISLPPAQVSEAVRSASLNVCLSARIYQKPRVLISWNFPEAVR